MPPPPAVTWTERIHYACSLVGVPSAVLDFVFALLSILVWGPSIIELVIRYKLGRMMSNGILWVSELIFKWLARVDLAVAPKWLWKPVHMIDLGEFDSIMRGAYDLIVELRPHIFARVRRIDTPGPRHK